MRILSYLKKIPSKSIYSLGFLYLIEVKKKIVQVFEIVKVCD